MRRGFGPWLFRCPSRGHGPLAPRLVRSPTVGAAARADLLDHDGIAILAEDHPIRADAHTKDAGQALDGANVDALAAGQALDRRVDSFRDVAGKAALVAAGAAWVEEIQEIRRRYGTAFFFKQRGGTDKKKAGESSKAAPETPTRLRHEGSGVP